MTGVTYIVTVYNKRPYLPHMLASLKNQAGDIPCQYVFVDDGSTDGSSDFIEEQTAGWGDVQIVRQANQGPAIALNTGIDAARQPYILLVDGDDVLSPHATRLLTDWADRLGCGVIHGDGTWCDDFQRLEFGAYPDDSQINPRVINLRHTVKFSHCGSTGVLLRTDAVRRAGACDDRVFIQEHSLFLRMANTTQIVRINPLLSFAPRHVTGRIMDNTDAGNPTLPVQTLHDRMLALAFFIGDNPGLAPVYRSIAFKNCATDFWKWLCRYDAQSPTLVPLGMLWAARLRYGLKNFDMPGLNESGLIGRMAATMRQLTPIRLTDRGREILSAPALGTPA